MKKSHMFILVFIIGFIIGAVAFGTGMILKDKQPEPNKEDTILPYEKGLKSIVLTTYNNIGDYNIFETINSTIDSDEMMKKVLTIISNKTVDDNVGGLGGTNVPYMVLNYADKTVKVSFYASDTITIDDTKYTLNYNGDALIDIKEVFKDASFTSNINEVLPYYKGIQSITFYDDFKVGAGYASKKLTNNDDIAKVLAVFALKVKIDNPSGLGGSNLPYLELNYSNKNIKVYFYGSNVLSVDGIVYEVPNPQINCIEEIKKIFKG